MDLLWKWLHIFKARSSRNALPAMACAGGFVPAPLNAPAYAFAQEMRAAFKSLR